MAKIALFCKFWFVGRECAICKCVQCALASFLCGSAKTKLFMPVNFSILYFFLIFIRFVLVLRFLFFSLAGNDCINAIVFIPSNRRATQLFTFFFYHFFFLLIQNSKKSSIGFFLSYQLLFLTHEYKFPKPLPKYILLSTIKMSKIFYNYFPNFGFNLLRLKNDEHTPCHLLIEGRN